MPTKTVTDSNFADEVLKAGVPVLVDFWATWCGPCKMLAPSLEEIADELNDKLIIAKVDVDESPEAPSTYGVKGVPTFFLFKDGEVIATKVGPMPKSQLRAFVDQAL